MQVKKWLYSCCKVTVASFLRRRTRVCSVWWWIPTKCCQYTQKRLSRCTRARNATRCRRTSTPSQTTPTGTCCRVSLDSRNISVWNNLLLSQLLESFCSIIFFWMYLYLYTIFLPTFAGILTHSFDQALQF